MICMAATDATHTLVIEHDEDPINPREDCDNFGRMICFHRRYNLGDKHDYGEPNHFLRWLVTDSIPAKDIVRYIKDGKADDMKLEYDRSAHAWIATNYDSHFKQWFTVSTFYGKLQDGIDELYEDIIDALDMEDLLELALQRNCILELYLYEHGGITMNTSGYSCPWDSGQVGWIYVSHEDVKRNYGSVTPETLDKAENLLRAEVTTYDYYISNQCYGFRLFEGEDEIDDCWGFLGTISDLEKEMHSYLPEECRHLIDDLSDCREDTAEEYFWNRKHRAC